MAVLMPDVLLEDVPVPPARPVAAFGAAEGVLHEILRPDANLAVWERDLQEGLGASLAPLVEAAPFTAVAEDLPETAVTALAAKLPMPAPRDLLHDIRCLATLFAAVAGTGGAVRLRLEAIIGPACHRWHADAIGLRLLCTYRGPGTEWLPLAGGARTARALDPKALPTERGRIATGAAAILKGERFPGNAGFGLIHRSPPAGPGERARLLLCLDEPGRIPTE
jgi:hypothetical protein